MKKIEKYISIHQLALGNCTLREYRELTGAGVREARRDKQFFQEHIKSCIVDAKKVIEEIERKGSKADRALLRNICKVCQRAESAEHCIEWHPPKRRVLSFLVNNCSFLDFVVGVSEGRVRAVLDGLDGMYIFGRS